MNPHRKESPDAGRGPDAASGLSAAQYPSERGALIEIPDLSTGAPMAIPVWEQGSAQFAARLRKMLKERRKWAARQGIACYRVYDADLPDYALSVDVYEGAGEDAGRSFASLAEYRPPASVDPERAKRRFLDAVDISSAVLGIPSDEVFSRRREHAKGGAQYHRDERVSHNVVTSEGGYEMEVDLSGYLDTGIFLDHRPTRLLIGRMARGARFLNLFAYTGTATVHAAGGGAASTVTVDMSRTYLAWARRNMARNGFASPAHSFVRADVTAWVECECASERRYDLIFVDPPTFSNSKAMGERTWSVQRDHVGLIDAVARLLAPGGAAIFSCNLRDFAIDADSLGKRGVCVRDVTSKTIPEDFARNPRVHHCYIVMKAVDAASIASS